MVFPIVDVDAVYYKCFIPGATASVPPLDRHLIFAESAFEFLSDSGSNRFCLRSEEGGERRHFALCELLRREGPLMHIKVVARCEPMINIEFNLAGNYLNAKFRTITDEPVTEERKAQLLTVLRNIKVELDIQWKLVGNTGRDQLFRRVEQFAQSLLGSHDKLFMQTTDNQQLEHFLSTYRNYEKLSFLLCLIVIDDDATRNLLITSTDSIMRLEAVLARLRSKEFLINIDGKGRANRQSLLRPNSAASACILFAIILIIMALKGLGYLDFAPRGPR